MVELLISNPSLTTHLFLRRSENACKYRYENKNFISIIFKKLHFFSLLPRLTRKWHFSCSLGDACDTNKDGDAFEDGADNCMYVKNDDQLHQDDFDIDGI